MPKTSATKPHHFGGASQKTYNTPELLVISVVHLGGKTGYSKEASLNQFHRPTLAAV